VSVVAVAGLLLTGGASRRLGRDKTVVPVGGRPCAVVVGERLANVTSPAIEVGPGRSGLPAVVEKEPGQGPLAAIAAGWRVLVDRGHAGPCLVLACDLPRISVPLLRLLAGWAGEGTVVPVSEGVPQTLCARYSKEALARAESLVAGGARSVRALLADETAAARVTLVPPATWGSVAPPEVFADLDTPADLMRLGLSNPSEDQI
jgi:molybdopterin-guanine dinucleotide biosynthesis protein A